MDQTPNLELPYIMAAQAQKHVTHNEAIRALDAVVHLAVIDRNQNTPPASPANGDRYIVAPSPFGDWTDQAHNIAAFQDGAWSFYKPQIGWTTWVADETLQLVWDGSAWAPTAGSSASVNPTPLVGVNATADTTNRFALSSEASLFNHVGAGHQVKINKNAASDTASLLYQTNWSGRAELGTTSDDNFHLKVSPDGAAWHEAIVIDGSDGSVTLPNTLPTGSSGTAGPVYNPNMQRAWSKCAAMLLGEASARLNIAVFGDSIAPYLREVLDARLKIEWVNGGFAGRLAGENGFHDDGNGIAITETAGDFIDSPNGVFWNIASGGSKHFGVGSSNNLDPLAVWHPGVFKAPTNVTRIGIYYTQRAGGGTFKVQTSTKGAGFGTYTDVPGLTAIDTNGTLQLLYQEVTMTATNVERIRIEHVSGGNCYVIGALVAADAGVVTSSWNVGGIALTAMIDSPRFPELTALVPADIVMAMYSDSPGDTASSTGLSVTQLVNDITNGIRAAFPSTQVPASVTPWTGKTALVDQPPHFVWFGANKVENPGSTDQNAYNAAIKTNALANSDCFVDTTAIWGTWRDAYDVGVMSDGDGAGASTHPRAWLYGTLMSAFLKETNLIGGAFMRPIPNQKLDQLQVGATAPTPGATNPNNPVTIGDSTTHFSAGPANIAGFGDIAAGVTSSGSVFECGFLFRSTASNGRTYLLTSQPGGGFIMRDTGMGNFLQFNAARQLSLAGLSNATMAWGPKGQHSAGMRHGLVSLTSGVATVTSSAITANARIALTRKNRGGTVGITYEYDATAGSFTITARNSSDAIATGDTSSISYILIEP